MATPNDAAYKIEQRNLRARAKATTPSEIRYDKRGCAVNPLRKQARAVYIKAHGVRQWKRQDRANQAAT